MFERFTERARQVVVLAQDEAQALRHNYIGTEHLLLGLLREEEGLAARALASLGVSIEDVRADVARIVGEGDEVTGGQIPFTPRAKKVLDLALREALSLEHNHIGTEHILLGLARENEGVASRIMLDLGADSERLRDEVLALLVGGARPGAAGEPGAVTAAAVAARARERRVPTAAPPRRRRGSSPVPPAYVQALALVLAAVGFPLGLLVGWLIWG